MASTLEETVAAFQNDARIEGARVVVHENGRLVHDLAVGTSDGEPIASDSVWWVASMTKPIVALATLLLIDEGSVALDDPTSTFIPEFGTPRRVRVLAAGTSLQLAPPFDPVDRNSWDYVPADRDLTVRDFLTMTSGLQTIMVTNTEIPPVMPGDTLASFVPKLSDAALDFQPGTQWHYSNATGFEVLARIVEVVSDVPFRQFVDERIFIPLGMTSTAFGLADRLRDQALPLGFIAQHPLVGSDFSSGSAGLFSTAGDYARFANGLLDSLRGDGPFPQELIAEMSRNQIGAIRLGGVSAASYGAIPESTNAGVAYGFGVLDLIDPEAAGIDLPAHSFGWDGIGSRRFWVIPELNTTIVMFVSGEHADALHRAVESIVRSEASV